MGSLLISGVSGIHQGMKNLQQHAHEIAAVGKKEDGAQTNLAKSLLDLKADQRQIEASVKVVKAADATLGTLLDLSA